MVKGINKYNPGKVEVGSVVINVMRGSPLGNKFKLTDKMDRMSSLILYRRWLWKQIQTGNEEVLKALFKIVQLELQGKTVLLECCCKPKACHSDIIAACVKWLIDSEAYRDNRKFGNLNEAYSLTIN